MALNWVEDIVSHLYKLRDYMVVEDEDLQMPRTSNRAVRGHSDIDVLALKENELLHVECQSWWGPSNAAEPKQLERLKERFNLAPDSIFNKYRFLDKEKITIRNIFVTSGKPKKGGGKGAWARLAPFCEENGIELVEINSVVHDLIAELEKKYPKPQIVGKEQGIARFLLYLIHSGFLK